MRAGKLEERTRLWSSSGKLGLLRLHGEAQQAAGALVLPCGAAAELREGRVPAGGWEDSSRTNGICLLERLGGLGGQ
jgi:hypothetical protein